MARVEQQNQNKRVKCSSSRFLNPFPVGSPVEVNTDEEDFKSVYFVATVIEPPPPSSSKKNNKRKSISISNSKSKTKGNKILVQYHHLLAEENGSEPLREYVNAEFVRPAPPQDIVQGFELYDAVDAFYRDGWWKGVVSGIVEGSRFVVTFQNPPDELQFGQSDLRHHLDWVNGSWVRPEKQRIAGLMFDVGKKIEVSFDKEDCRYAWFPATILEVLESGSFLVEYWTHIGDDDGPLKVTVDLPHIRPCPPFLKDKNFTLLEKVDAFFDYGWWSGVITKELEDSRYIVFFKQTKKDREFHHSEIRRHMEWKDGKWFTSSQDVTVPSPVDGRHDGDTCDNTNGTEAAALPATVANRPDNYEEKTPSSLNFSENPMEQSTPGNHEQAFDTSSLKKTSHQPPDSCDTLQQPLKKLKNGNAAAVQPLAPCAQNTVETSNSQMLRDPVSLNLENVVNSSAKQQIAGDQSSSHPSWGKRNPRKQRNVSVKMIKPMVGSMKKSGRRKSYHLENQLPSSGGKEPLPVRNSSGNIKNETVREETELPIVVGLPCSSGEGNSGVKRGRQNLRKGFSKLMSDLVCDQKLQEKDSATEVKKMDFVMGNPKDAKHAENEESPPKRGRGRPRKKATPSRCRIISETSALKNSQPQNVIPEGSTQNGNEATGEMSTKETSGNEVGSHATGETVVAGMASSLVDQEDVMLNRNDDKLNNGQSKQDRRFGRTMRKWARAAEEVVKGSAKPIEKLTPRRGRSQNMGERSLPQFAGKATDTSGMVKRSDKVRHEVLSNELENEPLSKWIEGMQSPTIVDGARVSHVRSLEQCSEVSRREKVMQTESCKDQGYAVVHVSATKDGDRIGPSEQRSSSTRASEQCSEFSLNGKENRMQTVGSEEPAKTVPGMPLQPGLPFVKNTILWETIESMEVLRRMPQKPHFQPLEQCKESSREGLAIGLMVTFSSVVEKASRLQFDDDRSSWNEILETLTDLEKYGFDIQIVQDRVTQMLWVKDNQEKLKDQVEEINTEILARQLEKGKIDEDIGRTTQQIRDLQEKLWEAESAKEAKDREIASLQSRLGEFRASISSAKGDFEALARAPF